MVSHRVRYVQGRRLTVQGLGGKDRQTTVAWTDGQYRALDLVYATALVPAQIDAVGYAAARSHAPRIVITRRATL